MLSFVVQSLLTVSIKSNLVELSASLQGDLFFDEKNASHQTMRLAYSTDASVYQELPLAVCIPETEAEDVGINTDIHGKSSVRRPFTGPCTFS